MNFFEHQERARRNTTRLVFLFALAVVGIGVSLYFVIRAAARYSCEPGYDCPYPWLDVPQILLYVVVTLVFILGASLLKILSLRGGGGKVATMLGGVEVTSGHADPKVRRLLNVVEEMALASGVPMPAVYLLEAEPGINAFAAGWSPSNAAVAVTRGALDTLNRDELQGVIAHEFSHVLNGDMRLNIKMMGILFGILALGETGRLIVSVVGRGAMMGGARRSSSDKKGGGSGAVLAILAAGVAVMIIGYVGTFIGKLIQAALSRQREFLADASAVQFTRNPWGIGGALKKIGGLDAGSRLQNPRAGQVGHLLFGEGQRSWLGGALATHPPLSERIRRIDPSFSPEAEAAGGASAAAPGAAPAFSGGDAIPAAAMGFGGGGVTAAPAQVSERVGQLGDETIAAGAALLAAIPTDLREVVETPEGASHLVLALLLGRERAERTTQAEDLVMALGQERAGTIVRLANRLGAVDARMRLPLVDLATPQLRRLDAAGREQVLALVGQLASADGVVTWFEAGLSWLLEHRLCADGRREPRGRSLKAVGPDLVKLLALLAHVGHAGDVGAVQRAFALGRARLARAWPPAAAADDTSLGASTVADLSRLLDRLAGSTYTVKQVALDAAAHVVLADGRVTLEEAEGLRLLAFALDCPLPPFLEAQVAPAGT